MSELISHNPNKVTLKKILGVVAVGAVLGYVGFAAHEDVKQQQQRDATQIQQASNLEIAPEDD